MNMLVSNAQWREREGRRRSEGAWTQDVEIWYSVSLPGLYSWVQVPCPWEEEGRASAPITLHSDPSFYFILYIFYSYVHTMFGSFLPPPPPPL
jgi:hypothetical protein